MSCLSPRAYASTMGLFKKSPKVGADGFERKTVQGYAHKGKVADALADGWEIERADPVLINGNSTKQSRFLLKRQV